MAAEVTVYDNVSMSAVNRCDRCGAQAYVEVTLNSGTGTLLFCAHHADAHNDVLMALDAKIADHRAFLKPESELALKQ